MCVGLECATPKEGGSFHMLLWVPSVPQLRLLSWKKQKVTLDDVSRKPIYWKNILGSFQNCHEGQGSELKKQQKTRARQGHTSAQIHLEGIALSLPLNTEYYGSLQNWNAARIAKCILHIVVVALYLYHQTQIPTKQVWLACHLSQVNAS